MTATMTSIVSPNVDRRIAEFLDGLNSSGGKPMEQLTPEEARAVLVSLQKSVTVPLAPADISEKTIPIDGAPLTLTIVRPAGVKGILPVFMFFHGGGWVLGDFPTHERFVRDVVAASGAVAVFPNYTRSPEAKYPTAINQMYGATKWVAEHGADIQVDGNRLAVVGNSVGGNAAGVISLMAKDKGGPAIRFTVMMWPVTDANFETVSYHQLADGHFLSRNMMKWFWDNYAPDIRQRQEIYASPLQASIEQLKGLPPTLIQVAENDVLRDEGEAYARKLDAAGVEVTHVRYDGLIHDWGLLNPISQLPGIRASLLQVGVALKKRLS
jgi:acetyl esterase/lipase